MKSKIKIINGHERWDKNEVIKAHKLIQQRLKYELRKALANARNLDAFSNADDTLSKKLLKDMFSDARNNVANMKLPKKYQNNKIYKEMLEVFKEGFTKK